VFSDRFQFSVAVAVFGTPVNHRDYYVEKNPDSPICLADPVLPSRHLPFPAFGLQVFPNLFPIHFGGVTNPRPVQGRISGCQTDPELPSMGKERLRSCSAENLPTQTLTDFFGKVGFKSLFLQQ